LALTDILVFDLDIASIWSPKLQLWTSFGLQQQRQAKKNLIIELELTTTNLVVITLENTQYEIIKDTDHDFFIHGSL
jgi:hypothetical protein